MVCPAGGLLRRGSAVPSDNSPNSGRGETPNHRTKAYTAPVSVKVRSSQSSPCSQAARGSGLLRFSLDPAVRSVSPVIVDGRKTSSLSRSENYRMTTLCMGVVVPSGLWKSRFRLASGVGSGLTITRRGHGVPFFRPPRRGTETGAVSVPA